MKITGEQHSLTSLSTLDVTTPLFWSLTSWILHLVPLIKDGTVVCGLLFISSKFVVDFIITTTSHARCVTTTGEWPPSHTLVVVTHTNFVEKILIYGFGWLSEGPLPFLASIPAHLQCPPCLLSHNNLHCKGGGARGGGVYPHLASFSPYDPCCSLVRFYEVWDQCFPTC